jgi:hypothetical protein
MIWSAASVDVGEFRSRFWRRVRTVLPEVLSVRHVDAQLGSFRSRFLLALVF